MAEALSPYNLTNAAVTYSNFECLRYNYLLSFNAYVTVSVVLPLF